MHTYVDAVSINIGIYVHRYIVIVVHPGKLQLLCIGYELKLLGDNYTTIERLIENHTFIINN